MRMTHRAALLLGSALALAAPLAAQAQQAPPDTIRFATGSLSPGFGQPEQGTASPSVYSLWPLYDSLTMVDPKGEVSGLLAESWKNIDKDTWQVTLKKGVKFHNGREFKASDVAAQFTYVITSPDAAATVAFSTKKAQAFVATARAIDDYTVEFKTSAPNPELPRQLAGFWMPDDKTRQEIGKAEFWKNPVGTGPYMKPNYQGGTDGRMDLTSFDGGVRKPKVPKLQIIALAEAEARVSAIASGQIDIAQNVPFDSRGQIAAAGHSVHMADRPSVLGWRIISVRKDSPFADKRVRQAANYAIDRFGMAKDLLGGTVVPQSQCATQATFGFNPDVKPYEYNPTKAKALFAEAGFASGFDTEIMVIPGSFPADSEIYQLAALQMSNVGIRSKLSIITFPQWLDMWQGRKNRPDGTMRFSDVFSNACHNFNAIPFDAYPNMTCKKELPHHCDPAETALLDRAMGEFDLEKRRALTRELMAVNKDQAQNIFFTELNDLTGLNKRVQGFTNTIQRFSFHDITLTR